MTLEAQLQSAAERAIAAKVFPGCVIGVTNKGVRTIIPVGSLRHGEDEHVREHTAYDLASVTKSVVTATLTLLLEYDHKLQRTDRVVQYLADLRNDYGATIEDLLTYRVKGEKMSTLADRTADEIVMRILATGFDAQPGERAYTNLPAFLLGLILEKVGGDSLDHLAQRYVFDPLGMRETAFFPDANICAPTEIVAGKEVRGVVHDESARVFAEEGRAVGHAGLFSTADDLLTYLEALMNPPDDSFAAVARGAEIGLGFEIDREWMGKNRSEKAFGKTGFTGTSILCDVERQVGLVILSNRTYPSRPQNGEAINRSRAEVADLVFL